MTQRLFDHKKIEKKWQAEWKENQVYTPDLKKSKNPFYNLMMFPYPSAEGLHVGNMYAFTGADVFGRFNRMNGKDVFEPIGLDGFGIHSENYAIKVGRHPKEHAEISEKNFYRQLEAIGNGFVWENRLETYDVEYYKWTQWLFIQLWKRGLAYKGAAWVNWCPNDKTVLADEQVEGGVCERCKTPVERKEMSSWFFRITHYADQLLENIETIQWPEKIKIAQRQWIGKNKGLSIRFVSKDIEKPISVWTKFWETTFGVTFLVLAPEHWAVKELPIKEGYKEKVEKYVEAALNKSEQERKAQTEKTGVDTGLKVINPVNGEEVPVWIADYVLKDVGTGAVMGVPAHDERDFAFAKQYNLPIRQVIVSSNKEINEKIKGNEISYEGEGVLCNSEIWNGKSVRGDDKTAFAEWMIEKNYGEWQTTYHLRDWLISRQRYWGPPIPMIFCEQCKAEGKGEQPNLPGWYAVPEENLPVELPNISDFKPKGDGTSPLENAPKEWKEVTCPGCGKEAKREVDVSDTFLDSSWYFLRYPSVGSTNEAWNKEITKTWLPVNAYIGGAEHAVLHLLYARFVTMVLKDAGFVDFEEPFPFLFSHGLIIKDGAKMSKSKGNVVVPDEYIEKFGADTLRTYLMFLGSYDQGGDFRDTGIEGMNRFITKIWQLAQEAKQQEISEKLRIIMHKTIKKVTEDVATFNYNTAIAKIMEFVNAIKEENTVTSEIVTVLAQLLAPFAPHMTEEIWHEVLKNPTSIHTSKWPSYEEKYLVESVVTIPVMIDGKPRSEITIDANAKDIQDQLETIKADPKVEKWLQNKKIKNTIFVSRKLVNFVTE
jgi:leucyl-tRNA synthetase